MRTTVMILLILMMVMTPALARGYWEMNEYQWLWPRGKGSDPRVPGGVSATLAPSYFYTRAVWNDLVRLGLNKEQRVGVWSLICQGAISGLTDPVWSHKTYLRVTFSEEGNSHGPVRLHFTGQVFRISLPWGDVDLFESCGNLGFHPKTPPPVVKKPSPPPVVQIQQPPPPPKPAPPVQPCWAKAEATANSTSSVGDITISIVCPQPLVTPGTPVYHVGSSVVRSERTLGSLFFGWGGGGGASCHITVQPPGSPRPPGPPTCGPGGPAPQPPIGGIGSGPPDPNMGNRY